MLASQATAGGAISRHKMEVWYEGWGGWQVPDNQMMFLELPALCFIIDFSYHKAVFNALSHDENLL